MNIRITKDSKIEKTDEGIFIDKKQVLVKSYLLYLIMFFCKTDREGALKIYKQYNATELLIFAARSLKRANSVIQYKHEHTKKR